MIGGCLEYTGAPYFSAISALRTGADIVHVFCREEAAVPIKSYSPELIVHPYFQPECKAEDALKWLRGVHAVVVGPGLGRDDHVVCMTAEIIREAIALPLKIVFDADGLWIVNNHLDLVRGKKNVVLTPNVVEYQRLCHALGLPPTTNVEEVSRCLEGVTVLQKGETDKISNGAVTVFSDERGSPRRCGGQGD